MKTEGTFTLLSVDEFAAWLMPLVVNRKITVIQNHHTFLPDYTSWAKKPDAFYWLRAMESFHKERGFSQIAQQITTFPDGSIGLGRPFNDIPAGIKGANSNGICIEHFGNFDRDVMTADQSDTIIRVNALLLKKFKLPVDIKTVVYHHWYNLSTGARWIDVPGAQAPAGQVKSCPGTAFFGGNKPVDALKNFYPLIGALQ